MWRVVENALSVRSHVGKPQPPPVENQCGQMCTERRSESATSTASLCEFSTENPREFTPNCGKNARRDKRFRVTRTRDCHDDRRVEKARPIHIRVWTDC